MICMDGVRAAQRGGAALILLDEVSPAFRQNLHERLAMFCFGAAQAREDSAYYSFESTINELLLRYEPKPEKTKLGMAGELIVHVFMPETHPDLTSSAVFLNKEERSIKKGFDLTFFGPDPQTIWYGEVKSGGVSDTQTAEARSDHLLKVAAADIEDKLGDGYRRTRWESALADAWLTLESGQAENARQLLRSDVRALEGGGLLLKNVVLAAAVMHDVDHCVVSIDGVEATVSTIADSNRFDQMRVLVVQQTTIEAVIDYLREVANG